MNNSHTFTPFSEVTTNVLVSYFSIKRVEGMGNFSVGAHVVEILDPPLLNVRMLTPTVKVDVSFCMRHREAHIHVNENKQKLLKEQPKEMSLYNLSFHAI